MSCPRQTAGPLTKVRARPVHNVWWRLFGSCPMAQTILLLLGVWYSYHHTSKKKWFFEEYPFRTRKIWTGRVSSSQQWFHKYSETTRWDQRYNDGGLYGSLCMHHGWTRIMAVGFSSMIRSSRATTTTTTRSNNNNNNNKSAQDHGKQAVMDGGLSSSTLLDSPHTRAKTLYRRSMPKSRECPVISDNKHFLWQQPLVVGGKPMGMPFRWVAWRQGPCAKKNPQDFGARRPVVVPTFVAPMTTFFTAVNEVPHGRADAAMEKLFSTVVVPRENEPSSRNMWILLKDEVMDASSFMSIRL